MILNKLKNILYPFLIAVITLSCSTAPSTNTFTHESILEVIPQWGRRADGIWYFQGRLSSPKIDFYSLRIDLSTPDLSVYVSGEAGVVSEFVHNNNLIAGINATPYDEQYNNIGLVVSNREVLSPVNKSYDALVFYREGHAMRAIIIKQDSIYSTENIINAVGGFYQILTEGEPSQRTLHHDTGSGRRHPRSAAGISSDGRELYLLVIDGRRPGSIGATELETALLLRALGSHDGINLDGGGSSTLALQNPDGTVIVANKPSEFGKERKVAACLGIR